MKVVVLGTGGTIAGMADKAALHGYRAGQVPIAALVAGLDLPDGLTLQADQVAQIDSKDMDDATWLKLARRTQHWLAQSDVHGAVITHGTDTLEETAFFLHATLDADKPVVLTGAMRPASDAEPDGPGNLREAIRLAGSAQARGVQVVFGGRVFPACGLRKVHPKRVHAFEAGDATPEAAAEEAVVSDHLPDALNRLEARLAQGRALPWVAWITSHAGAGAREVRALLAAGVEGLVVAGTGNATVHQALREALNEARAAQVPVVIGSRCSLGDADAAGRGARNPALTPAQARVALQLRLLAKD